MATPRKSKGQKDADETAQAGEEIAAKAEAKLNRDAEKQPEPVDLPTGARSHPPQE